MTTDTPGHSEDAGSRCPCDQGDSPPPLGSLQPPAPSLKLEAPSIWDALLLNPSVDYLPAANSPRPLLASRSSRPLPGALEPGTDESIHQALTARISAPSQRSSKSVTKPSALSLLRLR